MLDPVDASAPPENGAYWLVGEAMLETISIPMLKRELLTLFVNAVGVPTFVRDTLTGDTYPLVFAAGASTSDDVCSYPGCDLHVERATNCAVFDYDNFFRIIGFGDTGWAYTGSVRACPTRDVFIPAVSAEGDVVSSTLLPSGRLHIRANFPIDLATDTFEMSVDGVPRIADPVIDGDADSLVLELGSVPIGAAFTFAYNGPRSVRSSAPTTLATTAELTDFSLVTAPPTGAIDSRGATLAYAPGSLSIRDLGHGPRQPFAFLIALGDPGVAARLLIDATVRRASGGAAVAALVRSDGTGSAPVYLNASLDIPMPLGEGALWLLVTNMQDLYAPDDLADPLVIDIHSLQWMN